MNFAKINKKMFEFDKQVCFLVLLFYQKCKFWAVESNIFLFVNSNINRKQIVCQTIDKVYRKPKPKINEIVKPV